MNAIAHQRMIDREALDGYRDEAIAQRAAEIVTLDCTVSESVYMEALENLGIEEHARYIASCIRMARTLKRKVEIDEQHLMIGEHVAKAIAAYMMPNAVFLARKELEQ